MADTKISALTAVTTPATTDEFAVNQGGASKKETLAQVRGDGIFRAADYGTNGAAIQSAINAAVSAGGGLVLIGPGTWALGSTSLSIGGSFVTIRGAGRGATKLTYTGSAGAIVNSATATTREFCEVSDLAIDITGASTGACCLHVFNFYRSIFARLELKAGTTAFDCVRLQADGGAATYYNRFVDVECSTAGICVHFTGSDAINRNSWVGGLLQGNGQAIVSDCTASTNDTNTFTNTAITCLATPTVVQLGGSGGAVRYWTFLNIYVESSTGAWVCANAAGTAAGCLWLGGYLGNTTITTQDNLKNFVLVPGLGGLDWAQFSGGGTNADSLWFARDNGGITFGSDKSVNLYRGGADLLSSDDALALAKYLEMTEMSAPGTAAANKLRLYAVDTGGVTRLMAISATGVAVPLTDFLADHTIEFVIDGGGATITTGVKGDLELPCAGVITQWTALADQSGSIVVDIWKDTYANFPPTVADTITGSEKPTITSSTKGQDTSLNSGNGWAFSAGDILRFNVDSVTTIQRMTIALRFRRT